MFAAVSPIELALGCYTSCLRCTFGHFVILCLIV
jgi:hypothetical protein